MNLQNTDIKCHVCNGAGYHLNIHGLGTVERPCGACDGTGLSSYGQAISELPKIGICLKCDRPMVHYRKRGYVCRYCEG